MQRLKIFVTSTLLILTLFVLAISGNHSVSGSEAKQLVALDPSIENEMEREELGRAKLQKEALAEALTVYFDRAIDSREIVGAGVSIVKGDKILLSGGFGHRDARTNKSVNGQTIFRLGSLSKGFAGVLAAKLKDEGRLQWEDKVCRYIPEFQLGDTQNTGKITLAHLLSHSSGAPYHSYTNLIEAGLPLQDIAGRFGKVEPIGRPGELYSYQNALFALSGEIMQKTTGQEISASLEDQFFKPLEMCSTSMDHYTLINAGNIAFPHVKRRYGWRARQITNNYYNAIAAGGINASAIDMGRWMRFLLGHNPEVMSRAAIAEAFTPFIEIKGRSKYYQRWPGHQSSHYGFGWRIHKFTDGNADREKTIWHHGGSVNGFRNEIALFPEADLGICVLLNNQSRLAQTVIPDLYKIVQDIYGPTDGALAAIDPSIQEQ